MPFKRPQEHSVGTIMRFVFFFGNSLLITILVIVGVNFFVDPLAQFRVSEALFFSSERQVKDRLVERQKYEGLILGSSKVTAIQPEIVFPGRDVLNAAYGAARPEEILDFLQRHSPKVKSLAIGFDLFTISEWYNPYMEADDNPVSYSDAHYLLSIDTFIYSIATLYKRHVYEEIPQYTKFGALNPAKMAGLECDILKCDYTGALKFIRNNHFSKEFAVSERRLKSVAGIAEWARDNNIYIVAWINPLQREVKKIIEGRVSQENAQFREFLSRHFDILLDLSDAYPDDKYYKRTDPFHFHIEAANEMVARHIVPIIDELLKDQSLVHKIE